ncbi:reverse transcriptase domain-containing protein, partial [Shigella flexneri]|nr:reverse transcriptase domain-containing protein [Shigella flexneri]
VQGRNITENVLLAQEMLHLLNRKQHGHNIALKLDIAKTFDRTSRYYIIKVLRAFGFDEVFIYMIWRAISNCWFSVLVNGQTHGFFKAT